ncbi:MAG TPA: helicase C-terminal domain-containing protein [Anaerolineaceae bacterium]
MPMPSIVALDIETTGLDARNDSIIEIGAVRFSGHRIEAEWNTLVNPQKPIPPFISQLTGINNEMVRNAPTIKTVIDDFARFVGDSPVLGHNIRFDLGFLQKQKILLDNPAIDTYELAATLMPTASRYNLSSLGQALGILLPATHRALDDARVTHAVFIALFDKAMELPLDLVNEFVEQSEPFNWGGRWVFNQVLRARAREGIAPKTIPRRVASGPLYESDQFAQPLVAVDPPIPLNPDEISSILEYGGAFSRYFEHYEFRTQQIEMLRAITNAFSSGQHLMVEAGTGTGKSFAYLIPAALWSIQNQSHVVISTNTINLQEQLIHKDIPDLAAALNINLRAIVLKGRSNYLCPRHLEAMRQRGPENEDEMRVLAKIMVWQLQSDSGDRSEINLNGQAERDIWFRLSAEEESCRADTCAIRSSGGCPFYRSRQAAQAAHIIIVNHALLLADVATGNRVLPEYNYLIIDEAHHLEAATTSAMSYRVTLQDLLRFLKELGGISTGILGHLYALLRNNLRPSDQAELQQSLNRATDLIFRMEYHYQNLFQNLSMFLEIQREGAPVSAYGQQVRITPSVRTQPDWTEVEVCWDETHETQGLLLNLVAMLYKSISEYQEGLTEEIEDLLGSLGNVYRRLAEADANLHAFISKPDEGQIYWIEITPNNYTLVLQIAPLNIGPLMERYLWHEKNSIVLTSATLTANGGFDYLRNRLNADEADELQLGSPFDYENSALLYIVNDIPEPSDTNGHQRGVEQTIIRLSKVTGGRMLVLFTSYAQLKRTSQTISPILAEHGILVFEQGEGASPNTLLETFKESEKAVLLGTRSFWEGVDIPGQALSVLLIVKLPFEVPSDPIIAARSETFEDPFNEYQLPEAILRFRQGFGRLIRTQSDRGVVAVLDKRIITKRYGKLFLEALPECRLKQGPMIDLPVLAARWLNL